MNQQHTPQPGKIAWSQPTLVNLGDEGDVANFAGAGLDTSQPGPTS